MAYKALKSFSGLVSMKKGDIKEIKDQEIANDLLRAGYIEEVGGEKPKSSKSSVKPAKSKGGEA